MDNTNNPSLQDVSLPNQKVSSASQSSRDVDSNNLPVATRAEDSDSRILISNNNEDEDDSLENRLLLVVPQDRTWNMEPVAVVGYTLRQAMRAVFLPEPRRNDGRSGGTETWHGDGMVVGEPVVIDDDEGEEENHSFLDKCLDSLFRSVNCCHSDNNHAHVKDCIKMVLSILCLQISFLMWAYEQERIMTTHFVPTPRVPSGRFPSASFCVFGNRLMALLVSGAVVTYRHGVKRGLLFRNWSNYHDGGNSSSSSSWLRAFAPLALGNAISSWFQYSSLRFVSFSVQTMFKSIKIIPVMLLGRFMHGTRYSYGDYVEGILIAIGVIIFSLAQSTHYYNGSTSLIGVFYLLVFVISDAFCVQWQSTIYHTYGRRNVDTFQMMLGVNIFAILLTSITMAGDMPMVMEFLHANPTALHNLFLVAAASTFGQVVIFYFIREYGALIFTIVMTVRQVLFTCLSAVVFSHAIPRIAIFGSFVVFGTVAYQIRRNYSMAQQPEA
mmetsp:Transcript_17370/g.32958  ORF Transcript_17370/g.32958 Transcript_17370/m.32958 type:complete len:496 (+) Transcript_17370:87-1574(+)|eukprot:scaffold482_cov266-Amphora_coffeaeformis.AAC.5